MTKTEFIKEFAARKNISEAEAKSMVNAVFKLIEEKITENDNVIINGFGMFYMQVRMTKGEIGSHTKRCAFKCCDSLRKRLNKK